MPEYLTRLVFWTAVWPLPIIACFISAGLYLVIRSKEVRKDLFLVLFAFSMLGIVSGFLTGLSRAPAVGTVLPAVLSLFAGLALFLIRDDLNKRILVSLCLLTFSLNLLVGSSCGAIMRTIAEEQEVSKKYLQKKALDEVDVREFRKALGLPEWPYDEKKK